MPTQKVLTNLHVFQQHEYAGIWDEKDDTKTDPSRKFLGFTATPLVCEAVEACTLSGLRWEFDTVTGDGVGNQPWTAFNYQFVVVPAGGAAGSDSVVGGNPPYAPISTVIGWGTGMVTKASANSYHASGKSRAQRKLKRGDRVYFRITFNADWRVNNAVTECKNWCRGVCQLFLES